jgi:hypothetical protein
MKDTIIKYSLTIALGLSAFLIAILVLSEVFGYKV